MVSDIPSVRDSRATETSARATEGSTYEATVTDERHRREGEQHGSNGNRHMHVIRAKAMVVQTANVGDRAVVIGF
jgi:hypothetical protein